jgi:NlpC/P60 family
MRLRTHIPWFVGLVLMGLMLACTHARRPRTEAPTSSVPSPDREIRAGLSREEGFAIVDTALEYPRRHHSTIDCSHLVNRIYDRAGFPYGYATSRQIFEGAPGFILIPMPQPGDLVAWRGHVGIIVDPARHSFYSSLRSGPGVDNYQSAYWRARGQPRFFRYVPPSSARLR